jgi:glucokinase
MSRHVVAVDVGGTEIKAALATVTGDGVRIERGARRSTRRGRDGESTAAAVVDDVTALVGQLRGGARHPVSAVGVVVPGTVDEERGIGLFSSNLGWRDVPLRQLFGERIDLPVVFGHDVRAGGLAETRLGAARGLRNVVVMPIGTGIGAALVLGGRPHTGGGLAGEIGHLDIGHTENCPCGATGCLEAVASSAAIARRYASRTGRVVNGAAAVAAAFRDGDAEAARVWNEAIDALARGIRVLATLLAPEAVVLGGGLALAGDTLLSPLESQLDSLMSFQRRPELKLATLGDEAGCLGAALLAAEQGKDRWDSWTGHEAS